ncbi:MAG: hypothetical protein PHS04_09885 [Tissierellia bacterium]|nr:hypothetical protein [Tissierellia bacterium]
MASISTTVDIDFDPDDYVDEISDTKLLEEIKSRMKDGDITYEDINELFNKPYVNPDWASICEIFNVNIFSSLDDMIDKIRIAFLFRRHLPQ